MMTSLPQPSADAASHSERAADHIRQEIAAQGGWLSFADYMHLALYAPGLGYYSAGAAKLGSAGDFTTAPELTPLFARTLAMQAAEVISATAGDILELGAGSGKLAADLLLELDHLQQLPSSYLILEVSAYLRQVQREYLHQALPCQLFERVHWVDQLPETFSGLVLANEVLDALPVHLVLQQEDGLYERGVVNQTRNFGWEARPLADKALRRQAEALSLPAPYLTELCPAAQGLVANLCDMLANGVVLLLDYGFPRREYYHAQRNRGTLMCHYRHHAHPDPFFLPGLQDITSHVDFSLVADTAVQHGLQVRGYASLANFLINCGITDLMSQTPADDLTAYAPLASAVQKLLSPAEMGELFKVIALSRNFNQPLRGFCRGDRSHML